MAGGRLIRPVTQGQWRVSSNGGGIGRGTSAITGVDEARGLVYFIASKDTPVERQLYVTSYLNPGAPRQLTSGHGWWSPEMAETGRHAAGLGAQMPSFSGDVEDL